MLINIVGQWRLNDLDLSDDVSGVHCYRSNNYMLRERSKDLCQIKIYKLIHYNNRGSLDKNSCKFMSSD